MELSIQIFEAFQPGRGRWKLPGGLALWEWLLLRCGDQLTTVPTFDAFVQIGRAQTHERYMDVFEHTYFFLHVTRVTGSASATSGERAHRHVAAAGGRTPNAVLLDRSRLYSLAVASLLRSLEEGKTEHTQQMNLEERRQEAGRQNCTIFRNDCLLLSCLILASTFALCELSLAVFETLSVLWLGSRIQPLSFMETLGIVCYYTL